MLPGVCSAAPQRSFPRQRASRRVGGTARPAMPSGGSRGAGPDAHCACTGPPGLRRTGWKPGASHLELHRQPRLQKTSSRMHVQKSCPLPSPPGDFQEKVVFRLDL